MSSKITKSQRRLDFQRHFHHCRQSLLSQLSIGNCN